MAHKDLIKANAHYNDIAGTVAGDFKFDLISMNHFVETKGFDSTKYFPYAFSFKFGEPSPTNKRSTKLIIHAVDKNIGTSNKEISEIASSNNGEIPAFYFYINLSSEEFFNLFKRFTLTFSHNIDKENYFSDCFVEQITEENNLN